MATGLPIYANSTYYGATEANCVYAMSGQYGLLPRLVYYITLIFAIFGRTREWLIIGALVSALTYAGSTAIHAMALITSKTAIFDLDIVGCWAILSTGALSFVAMSHWSTTLRNSRAKMVVLMWGVLVGTALIFNRASLFDTPLSDPEPACYSSNGIFLQSPFQLIDPAFNCTYKCFSATKPLRASTEVIAVPHSVVDNKYSRLAYVMVGPIMFAAYASIAFDSAEHTPSQLCARLVFRYLDPKHREELLKVIYNASQETWYGGYFVLFSFVHRHKWSYRQMAIYFLVLPWIVLELLIDLLCMPLMVVNVVLNELDILASQLPMNEGNYNVGQWTPIVNAGLVIIAAVVNKYLEYQERAKRNRTESDLAEDSRILPEEYDVELEDVEQQTSGVVRPVLAHVETLRDMDQQRYRRRP